MAKAKGYKYGEHIISKWIFDRGYTREGLATILGYKSPITLNSALKSPIDYISMRQMLIISSLTGRPFTTILFSIVGLNPDQSNILLSTAGYYSEEPQEQYVRTRNKGKL